MNIKNLTQTFVIALAMMITLTIGSSIVFGQDKTDQQFTDKEEDGNTLEGVWQVVVTPRDCQTGVLAPFSFKSLMTFMQGGTISEDAADANDGPYRTSGHGIWKRTWGRNYSDVFTFFHFAPDKTFLGTIKVRENITLSRSFNSLTGDGAFEIYDPNGNLVFMGCANDEATRLTF